MLINFVLLKIIIAVIWRPRANNLQINLYKFLKIILITILWNILTFLFYGWGILDIILVTWVMAMTECLLGKICQQEQEAAGHVVSTGKKQSLMNVVAQLFPSYAVLDSGHCVVLSTLKVVPPIPVNRV